MVVFHGDEFHGRIRKQKSPRKQTTVCPWKSSRPLNKWFPRIADSKSLTKISWSFFKRLHSPKFNIAPEKWWLEDYFPIGMAYFQGLCYLMVDLDPEGIPFGPIKPESFTQPSAGYMAGSWIPRIRMANFWKISSFHSPWPIHGTGIFSHLHLPYILPLQNNHSCRQIYNRPMDSFRDYFSYSFHS